MTWYYRVPNASDKSHYPIIHELIKELKDPRIIELNIQQEAPDAVAEIF